VNRRPAGCAALLLVAGLGGAPAAADESRAASSWRTGEDATGTWGGRRTRLDDHGLHLDLDYTAESFARLAGEGGGRRAAYRGSVDLTVIVDTGKLSLWPGGTLLGFAQNGHGDGISPAIGALMPVSNLEAPDFTQLSELWYEQQLAGGRLRARLGKQDANRDFGPPRFPGNFVHSSYGALPTVPMPTFPAPGLGAVLFALPQPWLDLRAGAYQGAPQIESLVGDLSGGGALLIAAATATHDLGAARPQAARHSLGAWYHTADITRDGRTYAGNYGAFAVADLLVPLAPGDHRSVGGFVRAGWAPADRSVASFYVGGGLTYHPVRGADTVGLGAGHGRFPGAAGGSDAQSFVELFYKARPAPFFTVEPDLQLLIDPGRGAGAALVGGVRVKLKL
jgi:porin